MKKRGGDLAVIIFLLIIVVFILVFEFFFVYTAVFQKEIKFTGFAFGGGGDSGQTLITIYPEQEVGRVREDFYGVDNNGKWFGEQGKKYIGILNNSTLNIESNTTWHKEIFLESGINYIKIFIPVANYYKGVLNKNIEDWYLEEYIGNSSNISCSIPKNFGCFSYGSGDGYAKWSKSTDAHSGNYSISIANINDSSKNVEFASYHNLNLEKGHIYNISVWVKAPGANNQSVLRLVGDSSNVLCSVSSTSSTSWEYISCQYNYSNLETTRKSFRVDIAKVVGNRSVLWDDYELLRDGSPMIYYVNDFSDIQENIKFAYENNKSILIRIDDTPLFLANLSNNCANSSSTCTMNNYTLWGEILVDLINRSSNFEEYLSIIESIEIWNEPYGSGELSSEVIGYDTLDKALDYSEIYNNSYNSIKEVYPQIAVGGPSGYYLSPTLFNSFLSNFSDKMDFVTYHPYIWNYDSLNDGMYNKTKWLFDLCSIYSANCSRMLLTEWQPSSYLIKNDSSLQNRYKENIAIAYSDLLNHYPENISSVLFEWAYPYKYSNTANYREYPHKYGIVSEPLLDNELNAPYNVTKDFAHYHATGSMIVNSSSSNESINVVASKNQSDVWHITVIMTSAGYTNVSIDVGSTGIEALMDLKTSEVYPVVDGVVNVGVLEQYDVKHYESVALPEQPEIIPEEEEVHLSNEENLIIVETNNSINETNISEQITTIQHKVKRVNLISSIFGGQASRIDIQEGNISENKTETINSETSSENKTESESLVEIVLEYIIDTSSGKKKSSTGSSVSEGEDSEKEILLEEQIESEVSGAASNESFISEALSNKSYMAIIFILLGGIICVSVIIYILYKRKKLDAQMMITLKDWVNKAKRTGYNYSKMKDMLEQKGWNKGLVERALDEMNIEREPLY
ncbi:MAG: carbohydrate binding domain-containing protein [Nanobdellota archaeon]